MIITSECECCEYGEVFKVNNIEKVKCGYRDKEYFFGQCIQCDNKKKRKEVSLDEQV